MDGNDGAGSSSELEGERMIGVFRTNVFDITDLSLEWSTTLKMWKT